jgi:hypothetical protein
MFASLSSATPQAGDANPFRGFDLSSYFGSHAYSAGASTLDYSRGAASKTFDERYRQTAASMGEFRPLPPTTSAEMFPGIGVGMNSGFMDKYAMYGRDPAMYAHAAAATAQSLGDNTNSAFLTHPPPPQHSVFDPHRSLYPHPQNPAAYGLFNDRQYSSAAAAAKLTGHPTPSAMGQERDFMTRPGTDNNQMQDPYRCGMLYAMNRYTFGE